MIKLFPALIAGAFMCASLSSVAADNDMKPGKGMMMDMKKMDANGDGMISKEEFMKFHESMYNSMKKNKKGMIDMKEMEMMHKGMMKDGDHTMKGDQMMKGDDMMKDKMSK